MADIRRDWLTNQNTDWCFVVIGLVGRQSYSRLLQLKIDPVRQMGPPYWLAPSRCQRIYINIRWPVRYPEEYLYTSVVATTACSVTQDAYRTLKVVLSDLSSAL